MREGATYLVWAIKQFGLAEGLWRWFRWHGSPHLIPGRIRDRYRVWRLIDRRKKKSYSRTVYAVDRDGDLYLIECPKCHNTQTVVKYGGRDEEPCNRCGKPGPTHFHCYRCPSDFGWDVYLEDGLRELKDHRDGNPPNPCIAVRDDNNTYRLGIDKEASWWWRRYEVWYDFNPDNGKDAHGHKPYVIWDTEDSQCIPLNNQTNLGER